MINKRFFLVMFIVFFIINGCYLFKYSIYAGNITADTHIKINQGESVTTYIRVVNLPGATDDLKIFRNLNQPVLISYSYEKVEDDYNGNKTFKVTITGDFERKNVF